MKPLILLTTLALLSGCAGTKTLETTQYQDQPSQLGTVGLVVNDGAIYMYNSYGQSDDIIIRNALINTGQFARVELNSPYIPKQLRVSFSSDGVGSDGLDMVKVFIYAGTLGLIPTSSKRLYSGEFTLQCKGQVIAAFSYQQEVTEVLSLFVSTNKYEKLVAESFVSKLISDLQLIGGAGKACDTAKGANEINASLLKTIPQT